MNLIQSLQNDKIRQLHKLLTQRKYRRMEGLAVLEGIHLLDAFLKTGGLPKHVYLPQSRRMHHEIILLLEKIPSHRITQVSDGILRKISQLNDADELMSVIELPVCTHLPTQDDCVVLERVQDAGNVGAVLRSAAASGLRHVILSRECADAFSPKVLRAGMGAHFLLQIYEQVDLMTWLKSYAGRVLATALGDNQPSLLYDLI